MRALLVLGVTACAGTTDVRLELTDANATSCDAVFADVEAISLEVIATNARCRLAYTCPSSALDVGSLEAAEAALRATADVLVELPADEAQTVVINGRARGCHPFTDSTGDNHPILCGFAELVSARDGRLVIELDPDAPVGRCPESMAPCP